MSVNSDICQGFDEISYMNRALADLRLVKPILVEISMQFARKRELLSEFGNVHLTTKPPEDSVELTVRTMPPTATFGERFQCLRARTPKLFRSLA